MIYPKDGFAATRFDHISKEFKETPASVYDELGCYTTIATQFNTIPVPAGIVVLIGLCQRIYLSEESGDLFNVLATFYRHSTYN